MKKLMLLIKKIIIGVFLIYAYNKMASPLNVFIPMNMFTILFAAFCGLPSILMIILFFLICV